jgi:SOS-response transcriptional repressor LexA
MIRQRREELGLTQDQVAERAGISKPYLSNIETGKAKNPPTDAVLRNLEAALGFTDHEVTRAADLARTPAPVRQEHEMLEAQLNKYHSVLKELLAAREGYGAANIDELMEQIDAEGNILPLGTGAVVPVINSVAAGYPHHFTDLDYPSSVADEYVRCPDLHDPQAFAARVVGDSMEPDFRQGDIVVFSPNAAPANGSDCFVRFDDGETTFKRMYQDEPASVRLQPLNSAYPAQVHEADRITGLWPAVAKFQRLGGPSR